MTCFFLLPSRNIDSKELRNNNKMLSLTSKSLWRNKASSKEFNKYQLISEQVPWGAFFGM